MVLLLYVLFLTQAVLGNTNLDSCDEDCTCISGILKSKKSCESVPEAFRNLNITPNYVEVAPKDILEVDYSTAKVNLGNFIPPLRLVDAKTISYNKGKKRGYYTLLSIDFDGESNGKIITLLMNIRNVENIVPTSGDVIVLFTPPLPALGSGVHRHGKLLYEQKGHIDAYQLDLLKLSRYPVIPNLTQFTKTYHLGNPVAGNVYITELRHCDGSDECSNKDGSVKQCERLCKILSNCDSDQIDKTQCGAHDN
ncbi:protein D1-like [Pieris brassicae]|uniref:protein D1-like n=1 Tax=Pieris brassicae TaxID=7116 RepID=UPI001E65E33B|nr:protein D1-like [Pieris brassicae]XP_045517287.1 protein D1-like [Pieris brassicae]XP_045517288.1 protein D1-like [Pieris brassicae]XP_045517289.1 protein D1-like [Pieris brassicae]